MAVTRCDRSASPRCSSPELPFSSWLHWYAKDTGVQGQFGTSTIWHRRQFGICKNGQFGTMDFFNTVFIFPYPVPEGRTDTKWRAYIPQLLVEYIQYLCTMSYIFSIWCQIVRGAKFSAVPNCPFLLVVPNCPVPNCPDAKLS